MNKKYFDWIKNYSKNNNIEGKCAEVTNLMMMKFPELKRIRGHIKCVVDNNLHSHWWLIDKNNNIIDPTEKQFIIITEYLPHDESAPEPTGKCPNCGNYCYDYKHICSDKCAHEYGEYLNINKWGLR